MKHELRLFFTALMFYTRIPCPAWVDHSAEYLNQCTKYFPLIGWIVGGGSAMVLWLGQYVLPLEICVVLSMVAGVLITGAFHEDGLADVCDGFGGGWTKAKILSIMKDSVIGAYGVVGMVFALLLKYLLLKEIVGTSSYLLWIGIVITVHALSRLAPVFIIYYGSYSQEDATSKVKPVAKKLSGVNFTVAIILALLPILILQNVVYFLLLGVPVLASILLYRYFRKWIDGYTGDCLGATQQITEILLYLTVIILWKCI